MQTAVKKNTLKLTVDALLTVLLLCLMAYQTVGETLHEWGGMAMTAFLILHHILNRQYYSTLFKGKYNARRILTAAVNTLLFAAIALTAVCGMSMSAHAVPFLYGMLPVAFARRFHLSMSYWSFVLMGIHLGLHLPAMTAKVRPGRTARILLTCLFTGIAGLGLWQFLRNQIPSYLFFRTPFAFFDYDKPGVLVFSENLAELFFFAFLGANAVRLLGSFAKRKDSRAWLIPVLCIVGAVLIGAVLMSLQHGGSGAAGQEETVRTEEQTQGTAEAAEKTEAFSSEPAESMESSEHGQEPSDGKPVVYFTSDISAAGLVRLYEALGWQPSGKTAVKISTGEPPASNYLRPELIGDLVKLVDGTIVECNTAYGGSRSSAAMHKQVAADHGFTAIADFDLLDEDGETEWPVTGGTRLNRAIVGSHAENYSDWIILSHFKGHAMAGFGGAIKNVAIGMSSPSGKIYVHTAGTKTSGSIWYSDQDAWLEALGEMVTGVRDHVGEDHIIYINVMNRLSVDCDCDGHPAEPDMHDIGIVAGTDPVAVDQACIDMVYQAPDSASLIRRIERQHGIHTLEHAEEIGLGSRTYHLVDIDG